MAEKTISISGSNAEQTTAEAQPKPSHPHIIQAVSLALIGANHSGERPKRSGRSSQVLCAGYGALSAHATHAFDEGRIQT